MAGLLGLWAWRATEVGAVELARGPYLQNLGQSGVVIVWKMNSSAACSVANRLYPGGTPTTWSCGSGTTCTCALTGLSADAQYAYVPQANGAALASEVVYATDPGPNNAHFSFAVLGDNGDGSPNQYRVRDRIVEHAVDFMISTGDMNYPDGCEPAMDAHIFTPYAPLMNHLVFWPTLGNHDVHANCGCGSAWVSDFVTPANNPQGSERYYSFDYGNAHFAVVDDFSNDPISGCPGQGLSGIEVGSAQYNWLAQDLASTTRTWRFLFSHAPPYSSCSLHAGSYSPIAALASQHGVDVYFVGHNHEYARLTPVQSVLSGGQSVGYQRGCTGGGGCNPPCKGRPCRVDADCSSCGGTCLGPGTIYVITGGGGGGSLYAPDCAADANGNNIVASSRSMYHFTKVSIDGDVLSFQAIRDDGAIKDQGAFQHATP